MNMPTFGAEASLYKTSTYYHLASSWANGADMQVGLSQVQPILCNGPCEPICACKPTIGECFAVSTGPCSKASGGLGGSRTDIGCDCTKTTTCCTPPPPACTTPPTCGPCTGASCGCDNYPTCARTHGTQTCTDCHGVQTTQQCGP